MIEPFEGCDCSGPVLGEPYCPCYMDFLKVEYSPSRDGYYIKERFYPKSEIMDSLILPSEYTTGESNEL